MRLNPKTVFSALFLIFALTLIPLIPVNVRADIPPESNTYYAYSVLTNISSESKPAQLVNVSNANFVEMDKERGLLTEAVFDQKKPRGFNDGVIYLYTDKPSGALYHFDYLPFIDMNIRLSFYSCYSNGACNNITDSRVILALAHVHKAVDLLIVNSKIDGYIADDVNKIWNIHYRLELDHFRYSNGAWTLVSSNASVVNVVQSSDPWNAVVNIVISPELMITRDDSVKMVYWMLIKYKTDLNETWTEVNAIFDTFNITASLDSYNNDFSKLYSDIADFLPQGWSLWLGLGISAIDPANNILFIDYGAGAISSYQFVKVKAFYYNLTLTDFKPDIGRIAELAITRRLRTYTPITYGNLTVIENDPVKSVIGFDMSGLMLLLIAVATAWIIILILHGVKYSVIIGFVAYVVILTYMFSDVRLLIAGGIILASMLIFK